jgi:hypothetical protein
MDIAGDIAGEMDEIKDIIELILNNAEEDKPKFKFMIDFIDSNVQIIVTVCLN